VLDQQGDFDLIHDPKSIDANPLKVKSASLHGEFMFSRPLYEPSDMLEQHALLNKVGRMVDARLIKKATLSENARRINVANLKNAYERLRLVTPETSSTSLGFCTVAGRVRPEC
jgi:hypothetical protein